MDIRLLRCAIACAAVLAASGAAAQSAPPASGPTPAPACVEPVHAGNPLLEREARIAQFESLGEQCLKRMLVTCNAAASRELLDAGQAFSCSIGYEALLRRGFGGDFQAMLAWWRSRGDTQALN
jgi:hypothetical protein